MLADPEIDAGYIATPHTLHYRNMLDAITAGKHVLCEKPFTVGAHDSRQVFELAEHSSRFVMEAMWTFFLPAIIKAQEWIAQGRIGRVCQVKADFGYPIGPYSPDRREYNAQLGGGCLLEMGIYPVALAWLFVQKDPDDIKVIARKAPNGVEDDVHMIFNYVNHDSGCSATLATSFRSKLQNWAYIIGEDGYIAIPNFWRADSCQLYHLDDCIDRFEDGRNSLGLNYETTAVNEDILAGRQQSKLMPWDYTLRFQQHMERVRALF
jgi:predicted dehydrogenase